MCSSLVLGIKQIGKGLYLGRPKIRKNRFFRFFRLEIWSKVLKQKQNKMLKIIHIFDLKLLFTFYSKNTLT